MNPHSLCKRTHASALLKSEQKAINPQKIWWSLMTGDNSRRNYYVRDRDKHHEGNHVIERMVPVPLVAERS